MTRRQRTSTSRTNAVLLQGSRLRRCCRRRNVLLLLAFAVVLFFCWRNLTALLGGDDVTSIVSTAALSLYYNAFWLPPPPPPDAAVLRYLESMEKEQSSTSLRLVVVVPGHGDSKRLPQLHASLLALKQSTQSAGLYGIYFDCIVYVWKERLMERTARTLDFCLVQYSPGLWTHHMLQTLGGVSQRIVQGDTGTAASHVAILMDDVDVRSVNIPLFMTSMHRANLTVAAPTVPHGEFRSGDERPFCLAHVTGHVDMLFTVFTFKMWQCWLHQINITVNPLGWGYDVAHADLCNSIDHDTTHTGIIDHEVLYHRSATSPGNQRMYSHYEATVQMFDWLELAVGDWVRRTSGPNATVHDYKHYASRERSKQYAYCRLLHFVGRYSSNDINDNLVQALAASNPLQFASSVTVSSSAQQQQRFSIDLVDSIDDWFLMDGHHSRHAKNTTIPTTNLKSATANRILTNKWVGVWTQPLYGVAANSQTSSTTSSTTSATWLQFLTHSLEEAWGSSSSTGTTSETTTDASDDNLDDDAYGSSGSSSNSINSPASVWASSLPPMLVESLPNSVAWFVYTNDMAIVLSKGLQRRQRLTATATGSSAATTTVPKVCAVAHPILPAATDVDDTEDIDVLPLVNASAFLATAALVLLDQPHTRLRSLHQVETHRRKIWLVSTRAAADEANAAAWDEELQSSSDTTATGAVAADESQRRDDAVEMINVQDLRSNSNDNANVNDTDESDDEYHALLRQSLVLVDSYAEIGAYTAAIQALEWHIPYILRKLPGHVEYLGDDYPLYYSTLDDVQTLLDDEWLLQQRLVEAYDYLQRQRRELSVSHTVENLAQQVVDCTLEAMSGWAHN